MDKRSIAYQSYIFTETNKDYGLNKCNRNFLSCSESKRAFSEDFGHPQNILNISIIMSLYDIAVQKLGFPTIELFVKVGF